MSRFFVNSESDEEEQQAEEDQNDEPVQDEQQNTKPAEANRFFDSGSGSDDEADNKSNLSEKQKKFLELKNSLDQVLNNIELNQLKKAHEEFTKLQAIYKRPPKVIKKNENPHFLIRELLEITNKVGELAKSEKDLRKFDQDIKKFNRNFEKELAECQEHPEKFENDDDDENENEDFVNDDDKEDNSDNQEGDWFLSSSDEEEKDKKKPEKTDDRKKPQPEHRKDMTAAEAVEARLKAERNRVIDDELAKKELEEFSASRTKGKVITTVARLDELYQAVMDKELSHKIQLEICFTVEEEPSDQAIPLEDWTLILEFLPSLIEDAKHLVPLFERLNRDFWARSVHPRHLFTPDVARLHEILPKFTSIMEDYSKKLREQKEFALCARLENMLIEHIYHQDTVDIMPHALSIFELLNQKIFDESITNSFKARAALFLAFNLAVRKYPLSAAEVFSRIPQISVSASTSIDNAMIQVYSNRASAQIGIAAFNQGYYKLSYQCLKKFSIPKYIDKNLGQEPPLFPPWLLIDKKVVVVFLLLSAMLLDLPYLTVGIKDESKLLIKSKMHKDLAKESMISISEYQKIAVAINCAKIGDWKKSSEVAITELGDRLVNKEKFIDDLKKVTLCCFLLTARNYYESIKYDYLVKRFELPKEVIMEITNNMINGFGPIEKAPIEFRGRISDDKNFILFDNQEVESPFAEYGTVIQVKSQTMKESLDSLIK
ncbi:Translation initiation factor 3 subunit c [Tritrichomonas musculus]|uniref:Translation initiation factor 3 subunit c n=1 Tax=Tritrichomonas musculus TaxID=1915356 RepID=A0ABR2GLJ9_9EUKA